METGYRQILAPGEIICRENDSGDSMYIILSGSVEAVRASKRLGTHHVGDVIGEMAIFMDIPRTATLRTLGETILFVVDRENVKGLLSYNEVLANQISEALSHRQAMLANLGIQLNPSETDASALLKVRKHVTQLLGLK